MRTRPADGRARPAALLIVEPRIATPGDGLARLVAAVERHAHGASLWRYERDATPQLRSIEPTPSADPAPTVVVRREAVSASIRGNPPAAPGLRIAPESLPPETAPEANGDSESEPKRFAAPAPTLSDEELAMLLSDEPLPLPRPAALEREDTL